MKDIEGLVGGIRNADWGGKELGGQDWRDTKERKEQEKGNEQKRKTGPEGEAKLPGLKGS